PTEALVEQPWIREREDLHLPDVVAVQRPLLPVDGAVDIGAEGTRDERNGRVEVAHEVPDVVKDHPTMTLLVLKLVATPILIVGATLAGRRWGGAVSGWLVGLPLTSGPVSLFLALQHGRHFAARAAVGSVAGVIGEAAFFLVWGFLARRGWP